MTSQIMIYFSLLKFYFDSIAYFGSKKYGDSPKVPFELKSIELVKFMIVPLLSRCPLLADGDISTEQTMITINTTIMATIDAPTNINFFLDFPRFLEFNRNSTDEFSA